MHYCEWIEQNYVNFKSEHMYVYYFILNLDDMIIEILKCFFKDFEHLGVYSWQGVNWQAFIEVVHKYT